ncbi:hypothetical protein E0W72_10195 [Flavobacterium arcticum]|nr:hypothetical protein [Flavobacterium arcticum]KAF2508927.1 hypothetical protein E0W72_10195 [Flavobacterium arcticum]
MKYLYIAFSLLCSFVSYSQSESTEPSEKIYTTMLNDDSNLYALNDKGQLTVWDLKTLKKIYKQNDTLPKYTALAKNKNDVVYLGSSKGFVYRLKHYYSAELIYRPKKTATEIYFIFFNSKNEMYFVLNDGLYCVKEDKLYNQFKNTGFSAMQRVSFNGANSDPDIYFDVPTVAFIDSNDRIWMSDCMGEFGCTRNTFDANNNKILDEVTELNYIQSFTEDTLGNVYVTEGIEHRGRHGEIYKVSPSLKAIKLYDSYDSDFDFEGEKIVLENGLFIGAGAWNKAEKKLYFASSDGFYRAAISTKNKLIDVEKLFSPVLTAKRENLAIGMQMPVKQVAFTNDNRLLFLTAANGIGVYNGEEYIMLE